MRIVNPRTGCVLAEDCRVADSLVWRFVGLMGRRSLTRGEGLLLRPTTSVHGFFMRFPIDVLFLDAAGTVVRAYTPLRPWRTTAPHIRGARQAVELPAGTIEASGTRVGDVLTLDAVKL